MNPDIPAPKTTETKASVTTPAPATTSTTASNVLIQTYAHVRDIKRKGLVSRLWPPAGTVSFDGHSIKFVSENAKYNLDLQVDDIKLINFKEKQTSPLTPYVHMADGRLYAIIINMESLGGGDISGPVAAMGTGKIVGGPAGGALDIAGGSVAAYKTIKAMKPVAELGFKWQTAIANSLPAEKVVTVQGKEYKMLYKKGIRYGIFISLVLFVGIPLYLVGNFAVFADHLNSTTLSESTQKLYTIIMAIADVLAIAAIIALRFKSRQKKK